MDCFRFCLLLLLDRVRRAVAMLLNFCDLERKFPSFYSVAWCFTGCQVWFSLVEQLMHRVKRPKIEDKTEDGEVR